MEEREAIESIKQAVEAGDIEMSLHAIEEAHAENISTAEIADALLNGQVIENYPTHRRGSCCLVYGQTQGGRDIHVVCTTARTPLLIITIYEPQLPRWVTPTRRSVEV